VCKKFGQVTYVVAAATTSWQGYMLVLRSILCDFNNNNGRFKKGTAFRAIQRDLREV